MSATRKKAPNKHNRTRKKQWKAFDEHIAPTKATIYLENSLQIYQKQMDEEAKVDVYNSSYVKSIECDGGKCAHCDGVLMVDSIMSILICTNPKCAMVYRDRIDSSAEWRWYNSDDAHHSDPTRCGLPTNPLLPMSSFGCGVAMRRGMSWQMRKIKQYTDWQAMPYKEKAIYEEFQTIITHASLAGIPKMIIDDAMHIHKRISDNKTFRGNNRDGIIAASIYLSCKMNHSPRTSREIATIFHLEVSNATKGCKNAMSVMNDKVNTHSGELSSIDSMYTSHDISPTTFIERYCSRLQINHEFTMLAKFIALKVNGRISENTPHSIAVSIIYLIVHIFSLDISKRTVATVTDISEVTINKCFKKLYAMKNDLIPDVMLKKYNV
jgi:transcription initiation factor TFIIB